MAIFDMTVIVHGKITSSCVLQSLNLFCIQLYEDCKYHTLNPVCQCNEVRGHWCGRAFQGTTKAKISLVTSSF